MTGFRELDHPPRQGFSACRAFRPMATDDRLDAEAACAELLHQVAFGAGVRGDLVDLARDVVHAP